MRQIKIGDSDEVLGRVSCALKVTVWAQLLCHIYRQVSKSGFGKSALESERIRAEVVVELDVLVQEFLR